MEAQVPRAMDDLSKLAAYPLHGEADPVPQSLLASFPEQAQTLTLLYDVSRELTSILDRQELLRRIAQRVKKIVNYHVFTVMLWNDKTQHLDGVFAMHYEDSIPARFRVPLNRGITGHAAGLRQTLRIGDVRMDPRFIDCGSSAKVRSELVVPLLLQDRLIGVLDFDSTELHAFTSEHERMLSILAPYIAIALENSRLYEEARHNQVRLQSDLDTAREIQRQLLPRGAREVPGLDLAASYVPARELGGDFYDFLPYGESRLGIALGDVSGKGTAAALFGSLAIGMLREHTVEHPCEPTEVLGQLNRRLLGVRLDAHFVAMLFAVYDAGTRKLTIANSGAPYPLLVRDGKIQEIKVGGIPLGLFSDSEYEIASLDLQPGDTMIFASDGILESQNFEQEVFGSDRLAAVIGDVLPGSSSQEISSAILSATDRFSGPHIAPHDDRTLVVLRVMDAPSADFSKFPVIY
ncbi:MAG TPA: SpoIIE family protein phosphatase [Terriglobales bacterium]|nr:SpoIIE family protein phosphatase [Terriglobales bacterium]